MGIEKGHMVLVDYAGKSDGDIFDLTVEEKAEKGEVEEDDTSYEPVPVLIGEGYVIEGLEEAIKDMEVGEEREIEIPPEKAYGERDSDKVETYPEKEFKKQGVNVRPGEEVMIGRKKGRVVSVSSGRVRVDFNHPLAGKDLEYWIRVNEKVEDDEEIARHIYDYRVGAGEIEFEDNIVKIPASHSHGDHVHELPEEFQDRLREEILDHTDFEEVKFVEDQE